ncbi:hypothetical protein F2Q69_00050042 [Brassica cretica]|uniref:Uncharacterized protein n=1 Tax=Brassica cretica TaxID=69181 RepID=A0A8S9PYI9_BRACR|nr:hypothetical protein F2Q69_00050042 [Brassica cretica]
MDFDDHNHQVGFPETKVSDHISTKLPIASSGSAATGSIPQWQIDEIFGLTDFDQSYEYMENNGSSKVNILVIIYLIDSSFFFFLQADTSRRGDSDNSSMMRSGEEDGEDNSNCLGGGETSWAVPQIQSPPTASGLNWPRHFNHHSMFVPDISSSALNTGSSPNQRVGKRRRS